MVIYYSVTATPTPVTRTAGIASIAATPPLAGWSLKNSLMLLSWISLIYSEAVPSLDCREILKMLPIFIRTASTHFFMQENSKH